MVNKKVAQELIKIAKLLQAEMPYGREAGLIKRASKSILKKFGWERINIFEARNGSGFDICANKQIEQLPDINMSGGRENKDLLRELEREMNKIKSLFERIKIKPEKVVAHVEISRNVSYGPKEMNVARCNIFLKYDEGFYVTPIEFL